MTNPGITVEGAYSNSETEGVARATIGEGDNIVHDGDGDGVRAADLEAAADEAEADGDTERAEALRAEAELEAAEDNTATETQLANVNRDPDAVVEVTSQRQEGFEFYVSDTAVRAVQKSLKDASAPGGFIDKYLRGRELSEDERGKIHDGLAALGEGGRFGGCGQKQGYNQYNPLNWLVSPAHAQEFNCTIIRADGSVLSLGIKTYAECSDAIYAYLNSLTREERDGIVFAAGYASGLDLVGDGGDRNESQRALIDALYVLDDGAWGETARPYSEGLSQAYAHRAEMDANVRAVLGDDDLTLEQKDQRLREFGTSVQDIFMLAALGAIPGVSVKTKSRHVATKGGAPNKTAGGTADAVAGANLNRELLLDEVVDHSFYKHVLQQGEFKGLGIRTKVQFREHVNNVIENPSDIRYYKNGRSVYLQKSSGTVVVRNPTGSGQSTAFQPADWNSYVSTLPKQTTPYQ